MTRRKCPVLLVVVAMLLLAGSSAAAEAYKVTKTANPTTYNVPLLGGCDIGLDLLMQPPQLHDGRHGLLLNRAYCEPPLPLETTMSVIRTLLAAMHHDGYDLRQFTSFGIGDLTWPQWRERLIDCYVAQYGMDDRRVQHFDERALYGKCHIFPELNAVLAPYGMQARIGSMEESSYIDFRHLTSHDWGLSREWLARHRGHRGRALFDGVMWLDLSPIKPR